MNYLQEITRYETVTYSAKLCDSKLEVLLEVYEYIYSKNELLQTAVM